MEWPYCLSGTLEVLVQGFSLLYCFIKEYVAETVGLCSCQKRIYRPKGTTVVPTAEQQQRVCKTRL